ncbi:MAG TPA: hypothetical protein VGC10_08245 [Sphingomonas sp.]
MPEAEPVVPTRLFLEAIARRVCVSTTYNRMAIKLAPHVLYTRHDELFVDGVTVEREGKKPKELKLGTFKLTGLSATELTRRLFVPQSLFDQSDPKYAGTTLLAVEA